MVMVSIERKQAVALVRYDRGGSANALNAQAMAELIATAEALRADRTIQAVVLTGTARLFCAGIDLSDSTLWGDKDDLTSDAPFIAAEMGKALCDAWASLPQLTIAALEGAAIGGGAVLAQAMDWRVMARSSRMRLPEARLGFNLAWGGIPRLVALVGAARAKRMLFSDMDLGAEMAAAWGVADAVVDDGTAVEAALALAADTLIVPAPVMRMTKRAISAQVEAPHLAHADAEQFLLSIWMSKRPAAVSP
jgi:enoyl-CoA hydratase/3-hydroxyacyl-CoA dehydrogenase